MKKNWTKFLVVALSVMMVFAMTACGGGSSDGGEDAAEGTGVLHLGGTGPLTGPAALYGNAVKNGAACSFHGICRTTSTTLKRQSTLTTSWLTMECRFSSDQLQQLLVQQ